MNVNQQFVRTLLQIIDAVVVIEPGRLNHPLAQRGNQSKPRANRDHDGNQIAGLHGPAFRASRRHPTHVAVLLQTEVDRLAPFIILIVIIAARVEQQIAANGSHVAQYRRGDRARGTGDYGVVAFNDWVLDDVG